MEKQTDQNLVLRAVAWDVVKNIWIAAAVAVSLSFLSYIGARATYTPLYTSTSTFTVFQGGGFSSAYANMTQTQNMLETFRTVVSSQLLQKRVCEDMGLDRVPGTVHVDTVPETNLVTLSVTAERPEMAFEMLRSVTRVYPEVGEKVLGTVIMDVFEPPRFPDHPINPFAGARVMKLGFAAGFTVTVALMAAVFYLRDTVKTAEQAKAKLDTPLFATIYHEHRYKNLRDCLRHRPKSMLLSDPAVSFLYEETIKKISTKLLYRLRSEQKKVVLITSTVDGEGKSTIAMNLAQDLSSRGKKVLLIEGDLKNPGLAKVLRVENQQTPCWGVLLSSNQNPAQAVSRLGNYGFLVMLNRMSMADATERLASSDLPRWLAEWKERLDVILVDAPPVQNRSDAEVWAGCADLSLLVVRQNLVEAKYVNDSIDTLEQYGSGVLGCIYNDAGKEKEFVSYGSGSYGYGGYGYGRYGRYGTYGRYGKYGKYGK